jgi:hypothetical protein
MAILALLIGAGLGWALALAFDPRLNWRAVTDQDHARNITNSAGWLNEAMAAARAAGLNPTIHVKPIDDELAPHLRPFVGGVQRDGVDVELA